ncbi:MAG: hypothetical protein BK997_01745 [Candidatus Micrarchaeum sp. ARMAN-1]|jgi:hypothetical protein|nr:MAG: hypothetical protein BK997_01745 [Candidatus Micrarchaeum sp. ARMAN-1]
MNYNSMRKNRASAASRLAINLILLEFLLLIIQFITGMWMNLFAVFPSSSFSFSMYGMMQVMFSVPELMVHMMNGILIGLISIIIFMIFAMRGDYRLSSLSAIASVSIFAAGISGLEFMFSGFSNNVFSFIMSMGFIFTVVAYSLILYLFSGRT